VTATTAKSAFLRGLIDGAPFLLIGIPFATLFGVVAETSGLALSQTLAMSALVIAGASQFTALQLMNDAAPLWLVFAAALTVNLRMAMYAAALQPHLKSAPLWQRALVAYMNFDVSFALSLQAYEARPMTIPARVAYFVGTALPITPLWVIFTGVGALVGGRLFAGLPLDFAMPILFLSLTAPMLKTLAHVAAAVTSILGALALSALPSGLGLILAAFAAMAVGAEIERRMAK
jgi:predicted branched-subunit amino acid permease